MIIDQFGLTFYTHKIFPLVFSLNKAVKDRASIDKLKNTKSIIIDWSGYRLIVIMLISLIS